MKTQKTDTREIALEVVNFAKKYRGRKTYAVKESSFIVHKGDFHGFIGANGAGKTTTIKSIIGAYAKFEGEIFIFGEKHSSIDAKKRIGYIPERADFPKGMSLYNYLYYMANLSGLTKQESKKFANEKIDEFGLQNVRKDSPNSFSSGQKKKVLLAQALVSNPDLIIMDEPAANLDPKAREEFFSELKKLAKIGKTIFISSHILSELDRFVDSITIYDDGFMVYNGNVDELKKGDTLRYTFYLNSNKDLEKFRIVCKEMKLKIRRIDGLVITIVLKTKRELHKFVNNLFEKHTEINGYKRDLYDLQSIYNKFVKIGSVDTPEALKKVVK